MSMKAIVIYALSLTVGIGAVTHAKTQLIEQTLQETTEYEVLAYRSAPSYDGYW